MSFPRGPLVRHLSVIAFAAALAACGGGGSDSPSTSAVPAATPTPLVPTNPAPVVPESVTVTPACAGADCAAVDDNTYAGSGVGVWFRSNASGAAVDVPVQIGGLDNNVGQNVTLLLTNESGQAQPLSNISLTASRSASPLRALSAVSLADGEVAERKRRIDEFNRTGWKTLTKQASSVSAPRFARVAPPLAAGATRDWSDDQGTAHTSTLIEYVTMSDGTTVNFWVEDDEFDVNKVTPEIVGNLRAAFTTTGGIYNMLVDVGGPLWGTHGAPTQLISGSNQPVDIVIVNLRKDATPYGLLGFFWSKNNFLNNGTTITGSNESLSLYIDSETLYMGGAGGLKTMLTTLAHEAMHMQNFYRRGVQNDDPFDTWLEEMTAMMMEDFASHTIDPTYNAIRDSRFPDYLGVGYSHGSYGCNLLNWQSISEACDSYSVSGSFGGFLDRHFGLAFFRDVLNRRGSDSAALLNAAIQAASPGSSLTEQLRRWSVTSNAVMPAGQAPAGFGYPARTDGGYTLPAIDPGLFAGARPLPTSVPAMLEPYASFPIVRQAVKGTFSETIRVPAGTTLSVIIH